MHTLLIVDDEYFVREGLKSTINWAACGITVVGEATNGKDALQKVAEFSPDIIISDIKMPVMNGIVFIEELNKIKFDGEIILLSGYSDFDFAQKAIESGVFAYILKPLRNEVIIEKVKDAVKHLEKKRGEQSILNSFLQDSNLLKQKLLADCANGVLPESEAATKIRLFGATLITNGFVIVGTAGESQSSAGQTPLLTLAGGILDRLKDERNKCFCVEDLSGFKIITEEDSQEKVHRIVLNALEAYEAENGCPASVGISVRFETFTGFPSAYKQAETLSGNGLFPQICTVSVGGGENNAQYNRVIASAIELIGKEFGKDISIATVAKRLFVSESYLMHLFKANLGKTFNECLTGYRIVKAKELLLKSPDRVGIIAEQVGYNDVKYFASVFKKYTNMTPNEFVKARKGSAY